MTPLAWLVLAVLFTAPIDAARAAARPLALTADAGQASSSPQAGAPPASPAKPQAASADAYHLFLMARQRESEGDVEGAIKLYAEARKFDPIAAGIPAELAALYARANRASEAVETADLALKLDPDNVEAHFVLGSIYAAFADPERQAANAAERQAEREYAAMAIPHLEAAWRTRGNTAPTVLLVTLARVYLVARTPEKAIAPLQRVIDEEPDALDAVAMLADAYLSAGRPGDAATLLARAAEAEPTLYADLAEVYESQGQWKEAADACQKAVERGTDTPEIRKRWASALLNTQQPAAITQAREMLQALLGRRPNDTRALFLLSQAQRQANEPAQAEATARTLMATDPSGALGPWALALACEQQHRYQGVVDALQPLVDRLTDGNTAGGQEVTPLALRLGSAYLELNQPAKAIAALEKARSAAGAADADLDVALIQAQTAAKQFAVAADLAAQARKRFPEDERLPRLQAEALRLDGKMDQAVALLEAVRTSRPGDAASHVALAQLLVSGNRTTQAVTVLQQAQAKFADNLDVTFELGAAYEREKRFDAAEQAFRKVIASEPDHAQALNYLGYMLADRGVRLPEALDYIRHALKVDPGNPSYLDSLGWAYFKMNRLDLAESTLRDAASARPGDSAVQDHWGDLLYKLGRPADAVAAWRRALAGDGESINRAVIEGKIRRVR